MMEKRYVTLKGDTKQEREKRRKMADYKFEAF
jgi:hypothetical protein